MPQSFVKLTPALEAACADSLVLTTNDRLRRNLQLAFNEAQLAAGRSVWPTPRIRTLDGYLADLYSSYRQMHPECPRLLSAEAEYQLFLATAPDGAERLVATAQQAWQLSHQWQIPLSSAHFGATEDARYFLGWAERVMQRLDQEQAITRAQLAGCDEPRTDETRLVCVAFEALPSAFGNWLEHQRLDGTRIEHIDPLLTAAADVERPSTGTTARVAFDTPAEELAAAACWSRGLLCGDPEADCAERPRIGVVVPDLATRHTAVVRQFTAELDPLLETGTEGLLDVGGGVPLGDQPIWQAASDWLRLCYGRIAAGRVPGLLASRYLKLPQADALGADLPPFVQLRQILSSPLDEQALAELKDQAAALPDPVPRPFGDWLDCFGRVLDRAGWRAQTAGSVQYQAFQDIESRMQGLVASADRQPVPPLEALERLDQYLSGVLYAAESPAAPIQVLGYLETTGLQFTHLWIMGLDDQSWPQMPHLNPFLPVATRRRFQVPRTTPEQEAEFAADRLSTWRQSADNIIVSYARHDGESEQRPSPLIREFDAIDADSAAEGLGHPYFLHQPDQLESLEDHTGVALLPGLHRGGTGRVRDQAVCPIRGYAIHRLGLKESRPAHGLPDPLDRGTLIHEALQRLYEQATADGRGPGVLDTEDYRRAAEQALLRHYHRFPDLFREREQKRLTILLEAWNALEQTRADVTMEAMELAVNAEFGDIGLRLRIDRMDRINDALIVVDYKTGRIGNLLGDERLVDPQLPLYALCNPEVQGVLYAEINEQRPRLKGIAGIPIEGATIDAPFGGSWSSQRQRWQSQIDTLTEELRSGLASVTPYDSRACQNCHLQSFCRFQMDEQTTSSGTGAATGIGTGPAEAGGVGHDGDR